MQNINTLLSKKISKKELSKDEIYSFVNMSVNNEIKEYQISTMLNAIFFNGMSFNEMYWLTLAMRDSGFSFNSKISRVDKHSTGGVGDKVTLILTPLISSFNIPVFKISGRGLGFTGGTIDKLESVGIKTAYSFKDAKKIFENNKMAIIQQTADIVPADKIFYSIRNDTSTVGSLPLIVSSILSKKLALGSNHIYLDIKIGNGALFKDLKDAKEFANLCIKICKKEKLKITCYFTNMDEPLGKFIGNKLEVIEAMDFLQGKYDSKNLKELIFKFTSDILMDFGKSKSYEESETLINKKINSLAAFDKFFEWAKSQGLKMKSEELKNIPFNPKYKEIILSKKIGNFNIKSASLIGEAVFDLGGGRISKDSAIDYDAGVSLLVENGNQVKKNQPIIEVYSNSIISKEIIKKINKSYEISVNKIKKKKIILGSMK